MTEPISMVTISREFGSGGGDIAARLAELLEWPLVERELVRRVAERLGVSEQEVAERDEQVAGIAERVGTYLADAFPEMLLPPPPMPRLDHESVRVLVEATLREAAGTPPLVVVGHGAQSIFADRDGTLHARVWAPLEERVGRVARRLGLERNQARARVQREDSAREEYMRRNYGIDSSHAIHYDVIVNTARLDVESAAAALAMLVRATRQAGGA
ncbi:MAG: cytidylate kinase-like family protein [Thermoanaerobaculia bacterium]